MLNTGEAGEMTLRHSVPVGRANPGILQDTLSGTAEIRFRVEAREPVFVDIQDVGNRKKFIRFPIRGGKTYRLSYNGEAFAFDGQGQEVQRLYSQIPRHSHPQFEAISYVRAGELSGIQAAIDSARSAQMAPFDSLRASGAIVQLHAPRPSDTENLAAALE